MKIYENPRKFTKNYENLRKFTKIYENLRKSWKILENLGIYGGLMGPKIENVEISLVLPHFLKGQGGQEHSRKANNSPGSAVWEGEGGG